MMHWRRVLFLLMASIASAQNSPLQSIEPPPASEDSLVFRASLPRFEARDLAGRTWNSADLLGKVTVVQIWGTFCLPCRKEHPALQDFFSQAARLNHVQVLTI